MFEEAQSTQRVLARRARAKSAGMALACVVIAISLSALAGWAFDVPMLTHWGSATASTKPLSALGLLLAGTTIVLVTCPKSVLLIGLLRSCALACASAAGAIGVLCIAMRALGLGSTEPAPAPTTASVLFLLPSWATSLALVACGVGLIMLQVRRRWAVWVRWAAALTVAALAGVALMSFALDVTELYRSTLYHTMAYPTDLSLGLLSIAMSLAQPEYGIVAVVLRDDAGGSIARRVLPAVAILPPLVCLGVQAAIDADAIGVRMGLGVVAVIVASVGSVVVGVTARWLGEADIARRQSERRVRVLLAELDHRVRNTMAAVYSISEQTAARSESLEDFRKSYRGRLQAMARAHEALSSQRWQSVSLRQIVDTVVGAYSLVDGRTLQIQGEDVVLPSSAAMSLAITLNELATNAIKHGAWSVTSSLGQVKVAWGLTAPDELELDWQESGGPPPGVTSRTSFGFELIRGMVPHDMGGEVNLLMDPSGLRCRIRASIASARERSQTRTATVD